jgi:hypothetical protein
MVAARMPLARCAAMRVSSADVVGGMGVSLSLSLSLSLCVCAPPWVAVFPFY